MIRVGLIGEDPNDTIAIHNLLKSKYGSRLNFKTVCRNIRGNHLESGKFYRMLRIETRNEKFDVIICIRDLDGFQSETEKIQSRMRWFSGIKENVNDCDTVLLLNIWELEAILYADLAPFNKKFGTSLRYEGDPTAIKEPKRQLKRETRKLKNGYMESDCRELFSELDFDKVVSRCSFFSEFVADLERNVV